MRAVLSISIPPKKLQIIKKKAKKEGMTISAYVIQLIDEEEGMISEKELLEDLKQGEKDFAEGRYVSMGPNDKIEDFLPIKD
jgi:macrodomain Ter protein organizer (MatP/YcbG family)